MKQEIPKPALIAAAVVGVIVLVLLVLKLVKAGDPVVDPKLDEAAAASAAQRMGNYEGKAVPGSERAAREGH